MGGSAVFALLLGIAALVLVAVETRYPQGGRGWFLSTAGIAAIVTGAAAFRQARRFGRSRVVPVLAIIFGMFGTVLMLVTLIAASPLFPQAAAPVVHPPAAVVGQPATQQLPLAQYAGTVAFLVKQNLTVDGYPASLFPDSEGFVITPTGAVQLPAGTVMIYTTSSDRLEFSVILQAPDGSIASYDSQSDRLTTG